MAPSAKAKKNPRRKPIKDPVAVDVGDTPALADTLTTLDGPALSSPAPIKDEEKSDNTSSSNAQATASNDIRPRADSLSTAEANDMASAQLLAELVSTIPSPREARISISSISTNSQKSETATGTEELSSSPVAAWQYSAAAVELCVFLVLLFMTIAESLQ